MGMRTDDYAHTEIENTLIIGFISALNEADIKAKDLYIENENFEYDIYARKNGQILIENLNILSGKAFAILKESYISINKLTTNTIGDFTVELDDFSDAIGEGIQLINRDEQVKMNSFVEEEPINQIIQKNSYSNQEYVESEDSKDISDEEFNSF